MNFSDRRSLKKKKKKNDVWIFCSNFSEVKVYLIL